MITDHVFARLLQTCILIIIRYRILFVACFFHLHRPHQALSTPNPGQPLTLSNAAISPVWPLHVGESVTEGLTTILSVKLGDRAVCSYVIYLEITIIVDPKKSQN